MQRDVHHVEARAAGAQFQRHFRPLLLFRHLFEADLNAGHFLEFFLVRLQHIRARGFGKINFDLAALELLPVEGGLRADLFNDGRGSEQPSRGLQQMAPTDHG